MSFPPKMPLYRGSPLSIYNPGVDYFIDRVVKGDDFSFVRFQIEYWKIVRLGLQLLGYPGYVFPSGLSFTDEFLDRWGEKMVEAWKKYQSFGRPWQFDGKVFADHLKMITRPKPEGLLLAVSDRASYYGPWPPPPYPDWSSWTVETLKGMLPTGEVPFNSIVWRRWACSGEIQKFFNAIRDRRICVIAPLYYANFAEKLQLSKASFIEIDYLEESLHVEETRKRIEQHHESLKNEQVLYLMAGGATGAWQICKLHGHLKNCAMIEFGRALDVYYFYDDFKMPVSPEHWAGWLQGNPPKWVKEKPWLVRRNTR